MSEKRLIAAKDIVQDIRAGLTDAQLMQKYRLSTKGLQSAFSKLVERKIIAAEELYGQSRSGDDTVLIDDMRKIPRHLLTVEIPVFEVGKPEVEGRIVDITENGLGITGFEAVVGDLKSLAIPCRQYLEVDRIQFEAQCRWVAEPEGDSDPRRTGFQITKIEKDGLRNLRELIQLMTLGL